MRADRGGRRAQLLEAPRRDAHFDALCPQPRGDRCADAGAGADDQGASIGEAHAGSLANTSNRLNAGRSWSAINRMPYSRGSREMAWMSRSPEVGSRSLSIASNSRLLSEV